MHGSRRIRLSGWPLILSVLILAFQFSGAAYADDVPVFIDEYGFMIRSEPGEDPHLRVRVKENIQINEDYSTVAISPGTDGPSLIDPYGDGIPSWQSRMLTAWSILTRMMIDTVPR